MYRFLLTPRWLAAAALAVVASVVMVMLGNWQLRRYHERHEINTRIDAADSVSAVNLTSVLAAPTTTGTAGAAPGESLAWTKITVTGQYDTAHEIQARGRTVEGDVGFEILTPLRLAGGAAVLIDRGWVPAPEAGALASPVVPAAPTGEVTVIGQIHLSESRPAPVEERDGRLDTRRVNLPRLAGELPFPVYGAYVLLTTSTPADAAGFTPVPIEHEDAWQNGGYSVQWWLFSVMPYVLLFYQARREAAENTAAAEQTPAGPDPLPEEPARAPALDRVAEADRRKAAKKAARSMDRVEEADRRNAARSMDRVEEADRKAAAVAARKASTDTDGSAG
ncbi:SURF1 family protein [Actinoplanes sp. NPDC051851]|uniref:SURF1 family cytochrome oxidase biogenesis protein n=1 Tax=Actinoplanes sp. NPDC051851 TaxID=3154753 RepID=UPI0034403707